MKRRRATVSLFHHKRMKIACQKDQIKPTSGSYQYDGGDRQLDDVANSSEEDEGLQFKIGIPGSRTIFDKENHPLRRIFWISLTIVCCFLAFYQVKGCIVKYELENVINEVQIVHNETLIFPAVTMCNTWNGIKKFNLSAVEAYYSSTVAMNNEREFPNQQSDLLSLMKLTATWADGIDHNISITFQEMELACWFGRNKSCDESGDWVILHTAVGPCYSFRIRQPVRETGLFNGLYIKMAAKSPFQHWFYYIHSQNATPALNVYNTKKYAIGDVLGLGKSNTDVTINYHQAKSLNVRRNRCSDDVDYTTELCELECFSEQLVRHAGCLLPFMKLSNTSPYMRNSSICNTIETYLQAEQEKDHMLNGDETIWNRTGCNCIVPCFRTYYDTDKEKAMANSKEGRFRFRVFFQTRTFEDRTQKLEYGLVNLFCALGNSIGLQLGVSVLSLFEALEWGVFKLFRWLRQSTAATDASRTKLRRIHPSLKIV